MNFRKVGALAGVALDVRSVQHSRRDDRAEWRRSLARRERRYRRVDPDLAEAGR